MACESYDKLWRNDFYQNVSAKNRVQDKFLTLLKLKENGTQKKSEKNNKLSTF